MTSAPIPVFKKRLGISGFNASILPIEGGYLGLVRNAYTLSTKSAPYSENKIGKFILDKDFNTTSYTLLTDKSGRTTFKSWTKGPEDPRIFSPNEFYAVTCDTNNYWKPQISKIRFSEDAITHVAQQKATDLPIGVEKNWVLFNTWGHERHFLYSTHPFRFLRIDDRTGTGNIFLEYKIPGISLNAHNGAVVKLPSGFLATARVKAGVFYKHSVWILFDDHYMCKAISPPFRFEPDGWLNSDGTFKHGNYEMNMSIHLEDDHLVCCTGIGDNYNLISKYVLEDVLRYCNPV